MGGSNQSLFLISALVLAQGSAAVPLLIVGLLLSWAAAPGWTELTLMWPDRVGGIAATCAEAFRRYNPVLANLTGVCYWWGWVPTCGLTAILSATALHDWYFPGIPITAMAIGIVVAFALLNLSGIARTTRVVTMIAIGSGTLAFLSGLLPILHGDVDAHRALSWTLLQPFDGDAATLAKLRELGVDYAQGYEVGRPGPLPGYGTVPRRRSHPALRVEHRTRRASSEWVDRSDSST